MKKSLIPAGGGHLFSDTPFFYFFPKQTPSAVLKPQIYCETDKPTKSTKHGHGSIIAECSSNRNSALHLL
jgi:hypothetical protein